MIYKQLTLAINSGRFYIQLEASFKTVKNDEYK